jgi:putative endonuclease
MRKQYFVYILASKRNGTLYIGMTDNLISRVYQHKTVVTDGFTKKYKVDKLVYYQQGSDVNKIIAREKQLKKWNRAWKLSLIEQFNPEWKDLFSQIAGLEENLNEKTGFPPAREI